MIAELIRRGREEFPELDDDAAQLAYLEFAVASGTTLTEIAEELSTQFGTRIWREALSKHAIELQGRAGDGARDTLVRARARAADALVEAARMTAADPGTTRDEIAASKLKIDTDLWVAERWGREQYGQPKAGTQVSISLNIAHLSALQARQTATVTIDHELEAKREAGELGTADENRPALAPGEEEAQVVGIE